MPLWLALFIHLLPVTGGLMLHKPFGQFNYFSEALENRV
jgi:hypothetical protein